jgi:hypothetical protein
MTGAYNGSFKMFDVLRSTETLADLQRNQAGMVSAPTASRLPPAPPLGWHSLGEEGGSGGGGGGGGGAPAWMEEHLRKKVLHFSWHPYEECVAVAGRSSLFIYNGV